MNVAWSDAGWRFLRWFSPRGQRYDLSRSLFIRGMGVIYLIAIWSWWAQAGSLVGREGLVPAADFLQGAGGYFEEEGKNRYWNVPTLFWLSSSDAFISSVCALGLILALLVIAGLMPGPCLAGLWIVYLSLVTTGGVFMSFQWDILLLESGLLAILAAPWATLRIKWRDPPVLSLGEKLALGLCWFAVAKLMFQSGWVKLAWATSQNPEWWPEHTALTYHYMTQPLPTWTAWWMHQLPEWAHRLALLPMYIIEIILPFFVFLGSRLRTLAAAGFATFMVLIIATGNYTYFNWLTLVLCLPLVADRCWGWPRRVWVRRRRGKRESDENDAPDESDESEKPGDSEESDEFVEMKTGRALWITGLVLRIPVLLLLVVLNLIIVLDDLHQPSQMPHLEDPALPWTHVQTDCTPSWADELRDSLRPFHLASGYGLFRTMTTDRPEIILEGSEDGLEWREYDLRWKPDRLDGKPRFVAPHQPRVAWQFWFAALERRYHPRSRNAAWMTNLFRGLLDNDPAALSFMNDNPFPDQPPRFLRARLYLYDFTSREERRKSGHWWKRGLAGDYLPVISKDSFR